MKRFLLKYLVAALGTSVAGYAMAGPAFAPKNVEPIKGGNAHLPDDVRLRVSLVTQQGTTDAFDVPVALTICSERACYRSHVDGVAVTSQSNGSARLLEIAIPPSKINSVHFEASESNNSIRGDISLSMPLDIPKGFYGGEIFVSLERKSGSAFTPTQAVGGLFAENAATVYYDPKNGLNRMLDLGVRLVLPAGATQRPQVFSVSVHDTGEDYPMVDIYPAIALAKSGRLQLTKISRPEGDSAKGVKKASAPVGGLATPPLVTNSPDGQRTIELKSTGAYTTSGRLMASADQKDDAAPEVLAEESCATTLSRSTNWGRRNNRE